MTTMPREITVYESQHTIVPEGMADVNSKSNKKHAKKHGQRLAEVGARRDHFDAVFMGEKRYDRASEMELLNDVEFWQGVFVAVKGHFLYVFSGREASHRLLDVICLKGARVIAVEGGHFFKTNVLMVKEYIHFNSLRPAFNRRGAFTDFCCYCRNPNEYREDRSEWMLHIKDTLDCQNWVYFLQARSATQRTRTVNAEGAAAQMESLAVKEPPPPLAKATVFANMK